MGARETAAGWPRPYSSVQWAWVRALGVPPSETWADGQARAKRRKPTKRELRDAMGQRYGVRGL